METPSSSKRVTRSQTRSTSLNNSNVPISRKIDDSAKNSGKKLDRSVLVDITNDSPIVGLAMGMLETPSSGTAKKTISKLNNNHHSNKTPGSGEALLRGQVKTLLQRVEEEAELSKISLDNRPFLRLHGLLNSSPMGLLAPTPANTPMILDDLTHSSGNSKISPLPVIEEPLKIFEAVVSEMYNGRREEMMILESQKSVNRQLLLDFSSEKSESCNSTTESGGSCEKSTSSSPQSQVTDDDRASIWSTQVNASIRGDDDDDDVDDAVTEDDYFDNQEDEEGGDEDEEKASCGGLLVDELCDGISRMSVTFTGKHKRFEYNSDGELLAGDDDNNNNDDEGILRLKGLPTPKGKHLRFPEEEEEEVGK